MDFVAIDVETANADMASICQIGMASFRGGTLVAEWKAYVDPEDYFDPVNVSIHGISEQTVLGQPTLPDVVGEVIERLEQDVVVSHTHFDRVAVHQSFGRYGLRLPNCTWLDSARVARRTWKHCAERGYGLQSLCRFIGYQFNAHDALEDARAAGYVLLAAIQETGLSVSDWLRRVEEPIDFSTSGRPLARQGNPEGPLFGEVLVFTGSLEIPRREAANLVASVGCEVAKGVTKQTTLLVVGDQDIRRLAGYDKSSSHRKVEALIGAGHAIRILRETDFRELVTIVGGRSGS
jgi:DNA polymerase-3 subunit epsilon